VLVSSASELLNRRISKEMVANMSVEEREGYLAMVEFMRAYAARAGAGDLATLLADIELASDGEPQDPASWQDWLDAVALVRGSESSR
jgi:hypothetical protein